MQKMVERMCLLFEAGEYPDKGVTVTEGDLREIVRNSGDTIPVKIEHLAESPFDGILGTVTGLEVRGSALWGKLRQSQEVWELVKRAGARSLSVGLDMVRKAIVETSLVCRPRVKNAQVFACDSIVQFTVGDIFLEEEKAMGNVRQFAEGLIGYLKGVIREEPVVDFAEERAAIVSEREAIAKERTVQQIGQWKREGKLRATEMVEQIAGILLGVGGGNVVAFDGESVPVSTLFARFVSENGAVVPMGERLAGDPLGMRGGSAQSRLIALAEEKVRQEGVSYFRAFAAVASANPELAEQAREE